MAGQGEMGYIGKGKKKNTGKGAEGRASFLASFLASFFFG
jgi:hypothetical protein